ncbi:hypothetical protein Pcinc_017490 [Petrolisthes cinctipes]|uniref:Uncharacterized protein n=1 Tax=Petrolisthes cinctipes TaxID=88211 RepID=A0AAE1FQL6_PETCI|nr:hypothetical protein Pcinc_017490 [Petrolisthes cinctipes]
MFTARSSATTRRRLSCNRSEYLRRTGGGGPAPTLLLITTAPTNERPSPTPRPAPRTAQPRPLRGMQTRLLAGGDHHTVTAAATVAAEAATAATTTPPPRPPTTGSASHHTLRHHKSRLLQGNRLGGHLTPLPTRPPLPPLPHFFLPVIFPLRFLCGAQWEVRARTSGEFRSKDGTRDFFPFFCKFTIVFHSGSSEAGRDGAGRGGNSADLTHLERRQHHHSRCYYTTQGGFQFCGTLFLALALTLRQALHATLAAANKNVT